MNQPRASRPYMPGYGIVGPTQGSGLLPWSWAEQRLAASRNYWVAGRRPDGRPHAMPGWGVWQDVGPAVRPTARDPVVARGGEPVVIEGNAEVVTDTQALTVMLALENAKYSTDYSMELLDPAINATIRVRPRWAFGLAEGDFTGSPTRWVFEPE